MAKAKKIDLADSFSAVLDSVTFPAWQRDADLKIINCNKAHYDTIDVDPDTKDKNEDFELFRKGADLGKHVLSLGTSHTIRKHIVVGGERKLFEITEVPLETGTLGYGRDVSSREKIEKELERHKEVQRDLLENSASAIAIYSADTRLKFFNKAYVNIWKMDERWLLTEPTYGEILEVLREKRKLPEQADFQTFKKERLAFFTNVTAKNEEILYLPDGRTLRVVTLPHSNGGLLFSLEDMTDQIALERSYNTLVSVKKSTLDNLYEGIAVFGENGRLHLSNPAYAKIWLLPDNFLASEPHISEILEETKYLHNYKDDWETYKGNIIGLITKRVSSKHKIERTDGMVLIRSCTPLPDGANLLTYVDITDSAIVEKSLRAEKKALKEADNLKTQFLTSVSYELRSPLTSIKGFSEALLHDYRGKLNAKQSEYVQNIYDESLHLSTLIDDIIDVASINAGYMALDTSNFNIYDSLLEVVEELRPFTKKKGIEIIFNVDKEIGKMFGDQLRIQKAISNLINNSINSTKKGGKIIITANDHDKKQFYISVEDTGIGISDEDKDKVFDNFFTTVQKGTGLGLPIVRSLTELHGGTVELESQIGVGTKITCYLMRKNPEFSRENKSA